MAGVIGCHCLGEPAPCFGWAPINLAQLACASTKGEYVKLNHRGFSNHVRSLEKQSKTHNPPIALTTCRVCVRRTGIHAEWMWTPLTAGTALRAEDQLRGDFHPAFPLPAPHHLSIGQVRRREALGVGLFPRLPGMCRMTSGMPYASTRRAQRAAVDP